MNTNTLRNLGARKKHPSFVINRLGNAPINTTICQWFNVTQIYSLSPYRSHLHQQDPHTGWSRLHVATARCATDSLCHCFRKGEPLWNKPWKVYLLRQELVRVTSVHISSARTSNMGLLNWNRARKCVWGVGEEKYLANITDPATWLATILGNLAVTIYEHKSKSPEGKSYIIK